MKIYLNELSETPKDLHFSEKDLWLAETVRDTQESELERAPAYKVDFELRKLQEVVFLKSKLRLEIGLLCSRCANSFEYDLSSSFQCMFTRDRGLDQANSHVGVAHSEPTGATGEDLDIEVLEKDYIELADVLKEQIYLKLPFQPLCSEACKGICPVCGQNQNTQPCQCHRIKNPALANALKKFKLS